MNDLDTLRRYDAAPASMYDDVAETRAQARLEQIVATPPERVPERVDVPRRRPSVRALRLAAVGALVVGALIASIVLPGGRGASSAFASWTATPAVVPQSALDAIDRACREGFAQAGDPFPKASSNDRLHAALSAPRLLAVEQRGDFGVATYVGNGRAVSALLGGEPDRASALCFTYNEAGSPVVAQFYVTVVGLPATLGLTSLPDPEVPFGEGWSYRGAVPGEVGADEVELVSAAGGTMRGEGPFTILEGAVGEDVTGVVIHADGRDIEATVSGGHFLAWWPGGTQADWSAPTRLPDVFRVTLTLADGTVRNNIRPSGG